MSISAKNLPPGVSSEGWGPVGEAPGGHVGPVSRGLAGRPMWLGWFGRGWSGVLLLSAVAHRVYGEASTGSFGVQCLTRKTTNSAPRVERLDRRVATLRGRLKNKRWLSNFVARSIPKAQKSPESWRFQVNCERSKFTRSMSEPRPFEAQTRSAESSVTLRLTLPTMPASQRKAANLTEIFGDTSDI